MLYVGGQDENFFEWAQANINYISLTTNFRPSDHVRVSGVVNYQDYWRRSDGAGRLPRVDPDRPVLRPRRRSARLFHRDLALASRRPGFLRAVRARQVAGPQVLTMRSIEIPGFARYFSYRPGKLSFEDRRKTGPERRTCGG